MKKTSLLAITAVVAASFSANAGGGKVKIRHDGKMIEVSASALKAHINHGDVQLFAFRGLFLPKVQIDAIIASEYQQYQDATAEDEEFEDTEEGVWGGDEEL